MYSSHTVGKNCPSSKQFSVPSHLIGIVHPWLPQIDFDDTQKERKLELQMEQVSGFCVLSVLMNQFLKKEVWKMVIR